MNWNWTMSNERAFIENLLCQRFNFFLVFIALTIAGAINANDFYFPFLLSLGAVVSFLLWLPIMRIQKKLDIILSKDFLFQKFEDSSQSHPAKQIDDKCNKNLSMRKKIGYWIPGFCVLALLLGATLAWFGVLPSPR